MAKKQKDGNGSGTGKGKGDGVPNGVQGVTNRDVMQRMNFLWQAGVYLNGLELSGLREVGGADDDDSGGGDNDNDGQRSKGVQSGKDEIRGEVGNVNVNESGSGNKIKLDEGWKRKRKVLSTSDLASFYVRCMNVVGQKTTVKMDPGVKRTICRGCDGILIPGITSRTRIRPNKNHGHCMSYTCNRCKTPRIIPAPGTFVENLTNIETSHTDTQTTTITSKSQQNQVSSQEELQLQPETESTDIKLNEDKDVDIVLEQVGAKVNPEGKVDGQEKGTGTGTQKGKRKRKNRNKSRIPPLFARRSAGHVVFRGATEAVDMDGVYCV